MLDLSEEKDEENIATCVKYFTRMTAINQWLEMEIGKQSRTRKGVDQFQAMFSYGLQASPAVRRTVWTIPVSRPTSSTPSPSRYE